MNDFLNPYIAGAPVVEPSMFFGRQDVFDWIEQNLSGRFVNHILVIHGQRRVGKTSVLKQIPNHLPSHFIHVFFDLQGRTHTSLDRFQWWLAREICRAVNQVIGESIPIPEHDLFVQDGEYLAATFLPVVLSKLGESILLLTFDEFDSLSEPEIQQSLTKPLIAYLRRLFDLPNLNFIFSIGSSGHKLENMQASYTEFFKTALYRKISFLKQEDCAYLVTRPVEGMLTYEPAAVERIYLITSGHPYFTQLICHELFSLSQKTGRRTLTLQDVESVLEDVIERGTVNLKFVWDEASDLEKWVLSSLAHELQSVEHERKVLGIQNRPVCTDQQLASALHNQRVRFSENDLNTALVHLREKDVLTQDNHFVVELLCVWLLKNRPLDRVREELVQVNPIANRYNEIGDEFRELGQPDKAMESFKQALSTDPSNLRAQVSIAHLHLDGGDFDQAVQGYEAALRLDDDDIVARSGLCAALMALGEAAVSEGKFKEAEENYQRILTINPDHPEVHLRLSKMYGRQAEEALAADEPERALGYYQLALEHSPEDSQLAERYSQVKAEHTKQLIDDLLEQSTQAEEKQEWEAALDAIQKALQLAPDDPALLSRLAVVKEAAHLAKISSLRNHAREMERLERWEESIQAWESCLLLHPEDEASMLHALEHARRMAKIANDYTLAQAAIKEGRYSQAIPLLQGVIAQDATYKDAAKLLVDCLKARPEQMLKLPVRWLRWALPTMLFIAVLVTIITQWSHLSPSLVGLFQPKTPSATQPASITPPTTQTAGDIPPATLTAGIIPPSTATATGQEMQSFSWWSEKLTGGRAPDYQDDFSSTTLGEYWNNDKGAMNSTLQDGALRLNNEFLIGNGTLTSMNYILQMDLRFDGLSRNENFVYGLRITEFENGKYGSEYQLKIEPSNGAWALSVITDPGGQYSQIDGGNLGSIQAGGWYELGIIVNEQTIGVFWDDKELLTQESVALYGLINHFGLYGSAGESSLEIDNWRFWDLGAPSYMKNDWITSYTPTVQEDNFEAGQGWQFNPKINEKYQDGRAVLSTEGGETLFFREDLIGSNVAMEVIFSPRDMPDSASLVWFLGAENKSSGEVIFFEYFPGSGFWSISKGEDQGWNRIGSGWTKPTPLDTTGRIMFVADGNRISAFYEDTFLAFVNTDRSRAGMENFLSIRSNGASFAQTDISKIGFWNLDKVEWMTDDWITARPETVVIDNFTGKENLKFDPAENEKYEDGRAVVYTDGVEAGLTREDLQGKNIALEVSFVPFNMPDSAYVVWILGTGPTNARYEVNYSPKTGAWQICKVENEQWQVLSSGMAQPTPESAGVTFMIVKDANQVRVFMNQSYIGSADIDTSIAGIDNWLVVRDIKNQFARYDIYLIRLWDLGSSEQTTAEPSASLEEMINEMTGGRPLDFQDDFSGDTLQEYWSNDQGAQAATLQDGFLRLDNQYPIGQDSLTKMNYILQVDIRFSELSDGENLSYLLRATPIEGTTIEYLFEIRPSLSDWSLYKKSKPPADHTEIQVGNLGAIEAGRWYEMGIVVSEQTIMVFWDDKEILTQDKIELFGLHNYFGLYSGPTGDATLDIDNWRFWDLGTPPYMRNDWISKIEPTFADDNFTPDEGWQLSGGDNTDLVGWVTLHTALDNETGLTREEIFGTNFALEVSFTPRDMPEAASLVLFLRQDTSTGEKHEFEYFPATGFWQIKSKRSDEYVLRASGWTQLTPQDSTVTITVLVDGARLSAFSGVTFLGLAANTDLGAGTWNEVVIRSNGSPYAQVDITEIKLWDLDTPEMMIPERISLRTPTVKEDNFVPGEGWQFYPSITEKLEDGKVVLETNGGDGTYLSRDDFQCMNIALEATFIPTDTPKRGSLVWQIGKNDGDWIGFEHTFLNGNWRIFHQQNQQGKTVEETLASGWTDPIQIGKIETIMVIADVDQVSAFLNNSLIGSINIDRSEAGMHNSLAIISPESAYTRADILKIRFWNLDQ